MKKYIIMALLVVFLLGQLGTAIYITWPGNGYGDENHDHFPEYAHDMSGEVPGQEDFNQPGEAEGHTGAPGQE